MIKFFKKQKAVKQNNGFDKPSFDEKILTTQLIYSRPSDDFYTNLLEFLIPNFFNEDNPVHKQFEEEFRSNILVLSNLFSDILESGLQTDTIDKFYKKLDQIVKIERAVLFITTQTLMYWFHFLQNIQTEVSSTLGVIARNKCDNLSARVKDLFEDFNKKNAN